MSRAKRCWPVREASRWAAGKLDLGGKCGVYEVAVRNVRPPSPNTKASETKCVVHSWHLCLTAGLTEEPSLRFARKEAWRRAPLRFRTAFVPGGQQLLRALLASEGVGGKKLLRGRGGAEFLARACEAGQVPRLLRVGSKLPAIPHASRKAQPVCRGRQRSPRCRLACVCPLQCCFSQRACHAPTIVLFSYLQTK